MQVLFAGPEAALKPWNQARLEEVTLTTNALTMPYLNAIFDSRYAITHKTMYKIQETVLRGWKYDRSKQDCNNVRNIKKH